MQLASSNAPTASTSSEEVTAAVAALPSADGDSIYTHGSSRHGKRSKLGIVFLSRYENMYNSYHSIINSVTFSSLCLAQMTKLLATMCPRHLDCCRPTQHICDSSRSTHHEAADCLIYSTSSLWRRCVIHAMLGALNSSHPSKPTP